MPSRAVAYVDLTVSQVLELLVSSIACEPASYVLSVAHCLPLAVSVCATLHVYEAALCDQTYQIYFTKSRGADSLREEGQNHAGDITGGDRRPNSLGKEVRKSLPGEKRCRFPSSTTMQLPN